MVPKPGKDVRWQPAGVPASAELAAETATGAPRILLLPPSPLAVTIREAAEIAGGGVRYTARLTIPAPTDRPQHFAVTLVGASTRAGAELRGPDGVGIGPIGAGPDGPRWSVVVPATIPGPLEFTATAQVPVGRLPEPQVTLGGPPVNRTSTALTLGPGLTVEEGPPGWRPAAAEKSATDRPGATVWVANGQTGWILKAARASDAAADSPATASEQPSPLANTGAGTTDGFAVVRGWAAAAGWLAVLAAVVALAGWGRPGWWPERLLACGLLSASLLDFESLAGLAFLAVAAVGLAARALLAVRHVLR